MLNKRVVFSVINIFLFAISAAYPFVLYFTRNYKISIYLAVIMAVIWFLRAMTNSFYAQKIISIFIGSCFLFSFLFSKKEFMYWYPVVLSLIFFTLFFSSLFSKQTLIEKIARIKNPNLPAAGVRYTKKLTQIWCIFFIFNASFIAGCVLLKNYYLWTIYTGVISYCLMGMLFAGDFLYRHYFLEKTV